MLLEQYRSEESFDEMVCPKSGVRSHYRKLLTDFTGLQPEEFDLKRQALDAAFLRQGITFNVYGDSQGSERIFPFDPFPRVIPASEWERI
ncbi:MAG TPA: circularly permuted type 2 ATP-grasp protein, partial [Verrucomicrobiae bacterium]